MPGIIPDEAVRYRQTLNAKSIDWHTMYIDSYGAIALINKYFKEGSEETYSIVHQLDFSSKVKRC